MAHIVPLVSVKLVQQWKFAAEKTLTHLSLGSLERKIYSEEINGGLTHHFLFFPSAPEEFCHVFLIACGVLDICTAPESFKVPEKSGVASVSASGSQNSRILHKLWLSSQHL